MPPILDEKARADFDAAARALPIEGEESAAPAEEPAVEAGESSVTPNEAESSGAVEPQEEGSGAGENPPAGERAPQHIPYPRFKEVIDRNKELLAQQAQHEKLLADIDATAKARAADMLRTIAENNPELKSYLFAGEDGAVAEEQPPVPSPKAATGDPAAAAAVPAKPAGQDPALLRYVETLDKRLKLQEQHRVRQERERAVQQLQSGIEAEMKRFPIFKDEKVGALAQKLVGREVLTTPDKPVAKIVEEVAGSLKAYEETIKAQYVGKKATTARTVPAGVGSGGAAPPGKQGIKPSLADGSTKKAFAAGLKQLEAELNG